MNITSPLPARQLDLSIDTESMVYEIAVSQPDWILALITETLDSNLVPLSNRSMRDLIGFLCPAEVPDYTSEVEWASRRIMQERLKFYVDTHVVGAKQGRAVADLKCSLGFPRGSRRRKQRTSRLLQLLRIPGIR